MKKLLLSLAFGMGAAGAMAVTPLWMRDVRISPDGKQILFCYKGDIYKVASGGGEAVQLTTQDSYESAPVWSPDGKQIAFASDRFGNQDVCQASDYPFGRRNPTGLLTRRSVRSVLCQYPGSGQ